MGYGSGRVYVICLFMLICAVLAVPIARVSAQEMGVIIIYKDSGDADGTFTFTGSPGPLPSTFQITTVGGGGAQIFDVPAGVAFTITETDLPSGWTLEEIFVDGSASWTIDLS